VYLSICIVIVIVTEIDIGIIIESRRRMRNSSEPTIYDLIVSQRPLKTPIHEWVFSSLERSLFEGIAFLCLCVCVCVCVCVRVRVKERERESERDMSVSVLVSVCVSVFVSVSLYFFLCVSGWVGGWVAQ